MHGPPLIGWLLVALCGAAGVVCLLRLRSGDPGARRGAGDEALMGLAMAAMAVPWAAAHGTGHGPVLALPFAGPALAAVFAAAALRSLLLARSGGPGGHHAHHAVAALAMAYMALAPGHAELPAPAALPLATGLLIAYFAVYVLRTAVRLVPPAAVAGGPPAGPPPGWACRPEMTAACRVSMALAMLAMLAGA